MGGLEAVEEGVEGGDVGVVVDGFLDGGDGGGLPLGLALLEVLHEGLVDDAAQGEVVGGNAGEGEAGGGPVDGVGLGGVPIEGTVGGFELALLVGIEGGAARGDFGGPFAAVVVGGGVVVGAELVQVDPGEFLMELGGAGVDDEAFVAQKVESIAHPAPFFFGGGHERSDVVGHVPGVVAPDGGGAGLELDDPVGELDEFEEASFVLEGAGAHPEEIGEDAAEAAEGDGGEGGGGGEGVGGGEGGEVGGGALVVEVEVEGGGGGEEEGGGEEGEEGCFGGGGHGVVVVWLVVVRWWWGVVGEEMAVSWGVWRRGNQPRFFLFCRLEDDPRVLKYCEGSPAKRHLQKLPRLFPRGSPTKLPKKPPASTSFGRRARGNCVIA